MTENHSFQAPRTDLAVGTSHAGFTVTSVEPLAELSGCAYLMRHDATGARAMWLACSDPNKAFAISFKTPPADDTGVFHILEHSVLCGSDRYPVKEPFVNLLRTSMQTFLNALTFPDKTMYPVASTNTADLENLMGVYLDAVLHPAIWHRRRIFEQEGWHLEVEGEGPDARLAYNGVVFNEMKGALSDPDDVIYQALSRQLFPETAYRFESGGNPRAIPTLTYEAFLDSHARHYAPSNAYVYLYGDLDVDRELALVDERLRGAADRKADAPNELALQPPVRAPRTEVRMATAPSNSEIGLSYVIGTAADRTRVLAADVLLDALCGSNEAPLKRRVLDAGLADDFSATLLDGVLQPQVMFTLKGLRPGAGERFRALVESTCAELADGGIPRDKLEASLAQAEFNLREGDWGGYPDGVALAMQAMSGWLYDDERATDYLRYADALDELKRGLDEGLFERLLRELVCESAHCAEVELVPVEEGGDVDDEARELAELRAAMDEAELDAVRAEVAALRAEQEAPDAPEALATLPSLRVSDIGAAPAEPEALEVEAPLPCVAHELDTHGIDYVYHYFDLRCLALEELPLAGVLTELLGRLATARRSASDLDTLVETNLGGLDFFLETYTRDDDLSFAAPALVVGASALSEKAAALAELPREVWAETDFSDLGRIRDILTQRRVALEQYYVSSGHAASLARTSTYLSAAALASGRMGGIDYYLYLRDLLDNWDERSAALPGELEGLCRRVFTAGNVIVSFTGTEADRTLFWERGGTLGLAEGAAERRLELPRPTARREAFIIPSDVSYVASAAAPSAVDAGTAGAWQVAARVLTYGYLWNEVRVKGGAYGVGFKRTTEGLRQFWSYRDPSVDATLARYDAAAAWLGSWECDPDELDGYVVATVASHDAPVKPRQLARRQDVARFCARPAGWRDQVREQELSVRADDIRALAAALGDKDAARGVCVFGGRAAIQASGVAFDAVTELC